MLADWLVFNVFIPLLPVPLVALGLRLNRQGKGLMTILSGGQLCFYSTTLAASAIKDMIEAGASITDKADDTSLAIIIGGMITSIIVSTFVYGVAFTSGNEDPMPLALTSLLAALATTVLVGVSRSTLGIL